MPTKKKLFIEELLGCAASLGPYTVCLKYLSNLIYSNNSGLLWVSIGNALAPQFLLYLILRFFFSALTSGIVSGTLALILSLANQKKMVITDSALSWFDLNQANNAPVFLKYFETHHWLILFFVFLAILLTLILFSPSKSRFLFLLKTRVLLVISLMAYVLWPHWLSRNEELNEWATKTSFKRGIGFINWNDKGNVRANGLLNHLIQTSVRQVPSPPEETQIQKFLDLKKESLPNGSRPRTVVMVLCEGCWHDEKYFSDIFQPLKNQGFSELRSVSPAFGGATVNASFEVLFGLPSRTPHLSGVVYQNYANQIKTKAEALPQHFRNSGYQTVVIHNFYRKTWNRDILKPKLGFNKFISLEDMNYKLKDGEWLPDDSILYEIALKEIKKNEGSPVFLYLVTVYGHGPFAEKNGDLGVGEYRRKLKVSIDRLSDFSKKLFEIDSNALLLMVADHKPGLNRWFYESGVLPKEMFDTQNWWVSANLAEKQRGDVPAYIKAKSPEKTAEFIRNSNGAPLYCLVAEFNDQFLNLPWAATQYSKENKICSGHKTKTYKELNNSYPSWLYSLSLFEDLWDESKRANYF
ncbi:MAG: LTA synthase family protein [Pseudomonadota bacterium]